MNVVDLDRSHSIGSLWAFSAAPLEKSSSQGGASQYPCCRIFNPLQQIKEAKLVYLV